MDLIVFVLVWLSYFVLWGTLAVTALLFLRVFLTWVGANPFGRLSYNLTRFTEPMVRPLRFQFGGGRALRYDLIPLVVGVMILFTGLFIWDTIRRFAGILGTISLAAQLDRITLAFMLGMLIALIGTLYVVAIFLRFLLPFFGFGYGSRFFRFLFVITEPLLKPLRRFLVFGMVDFSPLVAMFIINLLTNWLAETIIRQG